MSTRLIRLAALTAAVAGGVAAILALTSGGLVLAVTGMLGVILQMFGMQNNLMDTINHYPLGLSGAIALYIADFFAAMYVYRSPRVAGCLLLALAFVGIFLGGPLAFGVGLVNVIVGLVCIFATKNEQKFVNEPEPDSSEKVIS